MLIKTRNTQQVNVPKTFLTNLEVAGTNVLRWQNPSGFSASWAIQVGDTGEQQSEVVLLGASTPAGTAGTLTANTLYEHPSDTPVYAVKYDQVVFERSTSGTAGTATPIGTVTYQPDQPFTQFDDTTGASTYAYRTRYRNSILAVQTSQSDWITPTGFTFYSLASMRKRIKDKLWNSDYIKDDLTIDNWINEWKDEMSNAVISVNQDYAMGTVNVGFGTNGLGTIATTDFTQMRKVEVTYNGVDYYVSSKLKTNDFTPTQTFNSSAPQHNWLGDTVFQVHPSDTAGTAKLTFYRFGTTLVNDTDELPLPMRSYTKSFVQYGLSQALFKDSKVVESQKSMIEANTDKLSFVSNIVPRDQSGPETITLTDVTTGEDDYGW